MPDRKATMDYNDNAQLDTSQVEDVRGGGGGGFGGFGGRGIAFGGGGLGVAGVVLYLIISLVGGGGGSGGSGFGNVLGQLGANGQPATADNRDIQAECKTGADADKHLECAVVADINSIQDYWSSELPKLGRSYVPAKTVWFSGQVSTGCGSADTGAGPFYCPADKLVYIDLQFYNDLKSEFGATGGPFVNAYVLAHEYGHHVQDLLGTEAKVRTRSGATSDSVRLELQADCYAGVWAKHATQPTADGPALINDITTQDFTNALQTASLIGDDYIQTHLGNGTNDPSQYTHGTSAEREKWLTTGYRTGDPKACDTFGTDSLG